MESFDDIKELLVKAKEGDMNAFGTIYQSFLTPMYRYIYFRVGNKELAEDLTQDVFLRVLNSIENINHSEGNPLIYFYTVARNILIDWYRKKKIIAVDEALFENLLVEEENPEKISLKKEDAEVLSKAISRLSVNEGEVITLKFIGQYSNLEISNILSKTEEAIRQLQSRGIKNLRKILNKKDFEI